MNKLFKAIRGVVLGLAFFSLYIAATCFVSLCFYCVMSKPGFTYQAAIRQANHPITLISAVLTVIVTVLIFKYKQKNIFEYCQIKKPRIMPLVTAFVSGLFLNILVCAADDLISLPAKWEQSHTKAIESTVSGNIVLMLIVVLFVAPAIEEFMIRGLFFSAVKNNWNQYAAIVVTSLFFGVIHGNPIQAIYSFLGGLMFCYFRVGGSLWYSIIAHVGFNMGNLLAVLLGVDSPWIRMIIGFLMVTVSVCGFTMFKNMHVEKHSQKLN